MRKGILQVLALMAAGGVLGLGSGSACAQVVISELMAVNTHTLEDEDGDTSDWIEIHNSGSQDVNLGGWSLTDDADDLTRWALPNVDLAAGDFLVVFASGKERTDPASVLHTNFRLAGGGEYLALVEPDGATVAFEYAPAYPDQNVGRADTSYGVIMDVSSTVEESAHRYFDIPTPGAANVGGIRGFAPDLEISQAHGFYDAPFRVSLHADALDVEIRYTTNGSPPTATTGAAYTSPIDVTTTTALRAAAFKDDHAPGRVATQTYIFLSDVIRQSQLPDGFPARWRNESADYEMDPEVVNDPRYHDTIVDDLRSLPTMSIVMNIEDLFGTRGIYSNANRKGDDWERPASVELFHPDGTEGFQIDCGIQIQGGYSRDHAKRSFRLLFKGMYGPSKLEYALFPDSDVMRFDTVVLRGNYNYTWHAVEGGFGSTIGKADYLRDEFSRRTQLAMGQPASHGTFVHLYLNGLYWGVYNVCERPDASFATEHLGGERDEWDVITGGTRGTSTTQVKDGNKDAWNSMFAIASSGSFSDAAKYEDIQAYVDFDNLIDYMLLVYFTGNRDAPTVIGGSGTPWNFYSGRRRIEGAGTHFFAWDSEWTLEESDRNVTTFHYGRDNPAYLFRKLITNPEFKIRLSDRIQKHFFNDGALTPQPSIARYLGLAQEIDRAIVGESARWGDTMSSPPKTRDDHWRPEIERISTEYLPVRTTAVLEQLRSARWFSDLNAPEFNRDGGLIPEGFQLTMQASGSGGDTIPLIGIADAWNYEQSGTNLGTAWIQPTYDDAAWPSGNALLYVESSSLPEPKSTELTLGQTTYYFRTTFQIAPDVDLTGSTLELNTIIDDGAVIHINGQEAFRLGMPTGSYSHSTFASRTVSNAAYEGPFELPGKLLHNGENLIAVEVHQTNANSSDIVMGLSLNLITAATTGDIAIYYTLDGSDPRLPGGEINTASAQPYTGPVSLVRTVTVKARAKSGDVWSALTEARFIVGTASVANLRDYLRVSEVMYDPAAGDEFEFLELHNTSQSLELVLGGAAFTNGIDFTFPDQISIPPSGYAVVTPAGEAAFRAQYIVDPAAPVTGPYTGKLSNGGEKVTLKMSAEGATILSFTYADGRGWPLAADGAGHSLVPLDAAVLAQQDGSLDYGGNWRASSYLNGSPGRDDPTAIRDIVLNEFQANTDPDPTGPANYSGNDWIELYNTTSSEVVLRDWYLSDGSGDLREWPIPQVEIPANGSISFDEITGFHVPIEEGFALNQDGEQLFLSHLPGTNENRVADSVRFKAQELDVSLGRVPDGGDYWYATSPSRGAPNFEPIVQVIINELMYNPQTLAGGLDAAEYIELINTTDDDINLWNAGGPWRLDGGVDYLFPESTSIPAHGALLIVNFDPGNALDLAMFREDYGIPDGSVPILGPYEGQLSNSGERVALERPLPPETLLGENSWVIVDELIYFDRDPFPAAADGDGAALHRISPSMSGNAPSNWKADTPSPGVFIPADVDSWTLY